LKLNLGCGRDLKKGYVNVDLYGGDVQHDLNNFPYPWEKSSIDEILLHNVLEHLPDTIGVMKELYRICKNGALVHIAVPHPRHDDFISDPTHCSPITSRTMNLFSKRQCDLTKSDANNPLAVIHDVDFELVQDCYVVEKRWMERVERKEITEADLRDAVLTCNNVVKQIEMTLRVLKNT
jgi:SAM-dependent methyltransferase